MTAGSCIPSSQITQAHIEGQNVLHLYTPTLLPADAPKRTAGRACAGSKPPAAAADAGTGAVEPNSKPAAQGPKGGREDTSAGELICTCTVMQVTGNTSLYLCIACWPGGALPPQSIRTHTYLIPSPFTYLLPTITTNPLLTQVAQYCPPGVPGSFLASPHPLPYLLLSNLHTAALDMSCLCLPLPRSSPELCWLAVPSLTSFSTLTPCPFLHTG
jgi:hypothetical protein